MGPRKRLVALFVVLALTATAALYYAPAPAQSPDTAVTARPAVTSDGPARPGEDSVGVPIVKLEGLAAARPEPVTSGRNPFRVEAARPAPRSPAPDVDRPITFSPAPAANTSATGPPSVRPIPLKFIGLVNRSADQLRIAILSDGRFVHYGRAGDIVDGRYRIVRIGEESIELEHVDGRGRQTLRLSGS
jgi:hypothetical protein